MRSRGRASESSTRSGASTGADGGVSGATRRLGLALAVAGGVIAVDQLTKWWAVRSFTFEPFDVVWTLRLRTIQNYGGSFGIAQGGGAVISVIGIIVICVLLFMASKARPTATTVAFGFFIGGAAGNIIDRVARDGDGIFGGGVVDFIDFGWWPVFNVADISLFIGVGLLLLVGLEHREIEDSVDADG